MDIVSLHGAGAFGRRIQPESAGDSRKAGEVGADRSRRQEAPPPAEHAFETLAKAERHAGKLRSESAGIDADEIAAARSRLASGELDTPEVYRAIAEKLLRGGPL